MSEPLNREEREEMRGAYGDHTWPGRCLNDLEALEKRIANCICGGCGSPMGDPTAELIGRLEKQHAADLEAQQAAMLKCIREERVSKQAERDTLRARCEQLERELDLEKDRFADLLARTHDAESRCGQLEWCESERNAARARCEQLEVQVKDAGEILRAYRQAK